MKRSMTPEKIGDFKANAKTYEVFVSEELHGNEKATTDHTNCRIVIGMAAPDELKDRLLHECLHAILDAYGITHMIEKSSLAEEDLVHALTPALLGSLEIKIPFVKGKKPERP